MSNRNPEGTPSAARALDALFAARVLGLELEPPTPGYPYVSLIEYGNGVPVPEYTSSLDAAWAGVEKRSGWVTLHKESDGSRLPPFMATVEGYCVMDSHPALALVKASLLAVGVTQQEIDDAAQEKEEADQTA